MGGFGRYLPSRSPGNASSREPSSDPTKIARSVVLPFLAMGWWEQEEHFGRGDLATVCDLVVAPDFQHQGIGRAILRSILQQLAVPKVLLACIQGQEEFYRKEGFLKHKSIMALYENHKWFVANDYLE